MQRGDELTIVSVSKELDNLLKAEPVTVRALALPDEQLALLAWQMDTRGLSHPEIEMELGLEAGRAKELIQQIMALHFEADVSDINFQTARQYSRYESMIRRYYQNALQGDLEAAKFITSVVKDLRAMLGLDAPERRIVGHIGPDGKPIGGLVTQLELPPKDDLEGDVIDGVAREIDDDSREKDNVE
jgi:hypothetical protein